jgi:hypothetical protein
LSFSSTTGAITGTPNAVFSTASITIEATNSGGSDSTTISISVQDEAPVISYAGSPFTLLNNTAFQPIKPLEGGGAATSWVSISGAMPPGLILNSTTGVISGTPVLAITWFNVTIEATNSAGSDTVQLQFTIHQDSFANQDEGESTINRVFEYIISEPQKTAGISLFLILFCFLVIQVNTHLGYFLIAAHERDLQEDEKMEKAAQYDKLYREKMSIEENWMEVGEPHQKLSKLIGKIDLLRRRIIPQSQSLNKAKSNLSTMQDIIKTPAGAPFYLRAILTSILRAYRVYLSESLSTHSLNGKIKLNPQEKGMNVLTNIRDGLRPKVKPSKPYKQLQSAGILNEDTIEMLDGLIYLMGNLNKQIHQEDDDSKILTEPEFLDAITLLTKFLENGFREIAN